MATNNAANIKTGASGTILQGQGVGTALDFSTATYPSTAGTSGKVLISDGTNIVSSTPTFPNASATSGKFIRSDGTNWIASTPTLPTSAGTSGKVLQSNGTNYVESTPTYPSASGSAGQIVRSDGTNNVYTTATYPTTTTVNRILYSSATNTISEITTANSGILNTDGSGVPSIATSPSASGTITGGTGLTATTGNVTITSGNLAITAATTSSVGQITQGGTRILHTFGTQNTWVGSGAGNFTLTGTVNVAVGNTAMQSVSSGSNNVAVGSQCMANGTITGNNNTIAGFQSGYTIAGGSDNTSWGYNSLSSITSGNRNTALGRNAGAGFTTSDSDNICIGYLVPGTAGTSNTMTLAAGTGTGNGQVNKTFIHGIRGITTVNNDAIAVLIDSAGQLGTVSSSIRFKENILNLQDSRVLDLRPVSFTLKQDGRKGIGLIAEEVEKIMPELVAYNQDKQPESIKYHDIPILLLKEIQNIVKRLDSLERRLKLN